MARAAFGCWLVATRRSGPARRALVAVACVALHALPARAELPLLRASAAPTLVKLGPTRVRVQAIDSFQFRNDTERCDLRIRVRSAPVPDPEWSTVCFGLDNRQAVPVGGKVGCRVHYLPLRPGRPTTQVEVEYTWGPRCAEAEFSLLEGEYRPRIDRLENELWDGWRSGPDFSRLRAALQAEHARHVEADAKLRRAFADARRDTRRVDEADLALRRAERVQADRTTALRTELFNLEQKGPELSSWQKLVDALRVQAQEERDKTQKDIDEKCAEIARLQDERARALDELRSGRYCSQCSRPASRIEREERRSFQAHLTRVQGRAVPAKQSAIDAEAARYDKEIEAARVRCADQRKRLDDVAAKWLKKGEQLNQQRSKLLQGHVEKVNAVREQLARLQREWADQGQRLRQAILDAQAAYSRRVTDAARAVEQEHEAYQRTLARLREEEAQLRRAHQARQTKLQEEVADLKRRWESAQRGLKGRLERWERVVVDAEGEGTP